MTYSGRTYIIFSVFVQCTNSDDQAVPEGRVLEGRRLSSDRHAPRARLTNTCQ